MSKHSRTSGTVSPLLWLVPVPFLLAIFLPLDLPRGDTKPPAFDRVAKAPERQQPQDAAASAAQRSPR
ncbi:MAG TPA: hypothetical protein VIY30_01070 [Burkholderiaceae bacterium]